MFEMAFQGNCGSNLTILCWQRMLVASDGTLRIAWGLECG